jgi:hypothetical protein
MDGHAHLASRQILNLIETFAHFFGFIYASSYTDFRNTEGYSDVQIAKGMALRSATEVMCGSRR